MSRGYTCIYTVNHALWHTYGSETLQDILPANHVKSFPEIHFKGTFGWSIVQMIVVHYFLGEKNIIWNLSTWNKSRLGVVYHVREYSFQPSRQDFWNAFINDIAARDRPKIIHAGRVFNFRHQCNPGCIYAFIQRLKKVDVKPSGPGALLSEMENKGPETHFYLPRNLRTWREMGDVAQEC